MLIIIITQYIISILAHLFLFSYLMNSLLNYYNKNIDMITNKFNQCGVDIEDEIWRYSNNKYEEDINKSAIVIANLLTNFDKSLTYRLRKIRTLMNVCDNVDTNNIDTNNEQDYNDINVVGNNVNNNEVYDKLIFCIYHYFSILAMLAKNNEQRNECFDWLKRGEFKLIQLY